MRYSRIYLFILLMAGLLSSCMSASKRKSATYYYEHKQKIDELLNLYDKLYHHQAFSAGFTDKSFKYYVLEVTTDSLRYIYNTEKNADQVGQVIMKFKYDTTLLRSLSDKLKETECLWLSKSSFYIDEKKETVTYLSFKSVATDRPFKENKYYILIFLPHPITSPDIKKRIEKGDLIKIEDLVYYTIGNRYR